MACVVCVALLQRVAACCRVFLSIKVSGAWHHLADMLWLVSCAWNCCSALQCVAACYSVLQRVTACCSVLRRVAACCSVLQRVAACCSVF